MPRNTKNTPETFWMMIRRNGGCLEFTGGKSDKGYGKLNFNGRTQRAHRVSWELTNGPIPDGMFVCHDCDNPPCINPMHLFLGTAVENSRDMVDKHRQASGHRNGRSVLTPEQVMEIRSNPKIPAARLARKYGVHHSSVKNVRKGKSHKESLTAVCEAFGIAPGGGE